MEITVFLECPSTEILGVYGEDIHLLTHGFKEHDDDTTEDIECIILIPEKTYIKEWKKWINGKRNYCELNNHYCGVMGYVTKDNPKLIGTQKINRYNELTEEDDVIELDVYKIRSFDNEPDFEHG